MNCTDNNMRFQVSLTVSWQFIFVVGVIVYLFVFCNCISITVMGVYFTCTDIIYGLSSQIHSFIAFIYNSSFRHQMSRLLY